MYTFNALYSNLIGKNNNTIIVHSDEELLHTDNCRQYGYDCATEHEWIVVNKTRKIQKYYRYPFQRTTYWNFNGVLKGNWSDLGKWLK